MNSIRYLLTLVKAQQKLILNIKQTSILSRRVKYDYLKAFPGGEHGKCTQRECALFI